MKNGMPMKKEERFVKIYEEGTLFGRVLLVDKETGVTYLVVESGFGLSVTPLIDAVGKPIITKLD